MKRSAFFITVAYMACITAPVSGINLDTEQALSNEDYDLAEFAQADAAFTN